jgi:hypothetical protein
MSLIAHVNSDDLDWLYCFCSAYQIPLLSSNNGHDRIKTNFSISLITDILSALTTLILRYQITQLIYI